ncbi:MAG: hypothetical protein ABTQ27_03475, partial [Amaricoccus sp.]|uniref:hypothetical protein n=1 Tax=Amaricoccus sp. TaxID=1872485 RepID=UPI0033160293
MNEMTHSFGEIDAMAASGVNLDALIPTAHLVDFPTKRAGGTRGTGPTKPRHRLGRADRWRAGGPEA